jgi:hypothetical protein
MADIIVLLLRSNLLRGIGGIAMAVADARLTGREVGGEE